jgi:hypothetical protein
LQGDWRIRVLDFSYVMAEGNEAEYGGEKRSRGEFEIDDISWKGE